MTLKIEDIRAEGVTAFVGNTVDVDVTTEDGTKETVTIQATSDDPDLPAKAEFAVDQGYGVPTEPSDSEST